MIHQFNAVKVQVVGAAAGYGLVLIEDGGEGVGWGPERAAFHRATPRTVGSRGRWCRLSTASLVSWFLRGWLSADLGLWDDLGRRWGWGRRGFDRGRGLRGLKGFF